MGTNPIELIELNVAAPPSAAGGYAIRIGAGELDRVGAAMLGAGLRAGPAALVSDTNVAPLYAERLERSLAASGFEVTRCVLPAGERHKTLATVTDLFGQFGAAGLDRGAPVIALGGGVVGDLAGFAAATWLRGVPVVQVPSTLLAMVDSSVGGKTGVDLPSGKNLAGAFKQPALVVIDPDLLATLPPLELQAGLGEVVKHGLLGDPGLFELLEAGLPDDLAALVARAVQVKVAVVQEDPFERGRRALLNLGHTFGHALELETAFTLRHGLAVGLGLIAAADLSARLGRCDEALTERVAACLAGLGLPTTLAHPGLTAASVRGAMALDKKRRGKTLRFVIPESIGAAALIDDPGAALVEAAIERILTT